MWIPAILTLAACQGKVESPPEPTKPLSLLILHTDYSDFPGIRYSAGELSAVGVNIKACWNANSYGQIELEYTVTYLLRMPKTKGWEGRRDRIPPGDHVRRLYPVIPVHIIRMMQSAGTYK